MDLSSRAGMCSVCFLLAAAFFGPPAGAQQPDPRGTELAFVECIFPDMNGVARAPAPVTLGIPLLPEAGVRDLPQGRPALGIDGGGRVVAWQFSTYEKGDPGDPNSPVVWATLDLVLDSIGSQQELRGIYLVSGTGSSGGPELARDTGARIEIDTGVAQFAIRKEGFAFLDEAWAEGVPVLFPGAETGLFVRGYDGIVYASRWGKSEVTIVRNGPACAKVRVLGELTDDSGERTLASYVCELVAYARSNVLQGRLSLIGGHAANRSDLLFDWGRLVCHVAPGGQGPETFDVTVAKDSADGNDTFSRSLGLDRVLSLVQFQTDRPLLGDENRYYYPGLPKRDVLSTNTSPERLLTGYRVIEIDRWGNRTEWIAESDPARYPAYHVVQMRRSGTPVGLTLLAKHAATRFPAGIECSGAGSAALELWPDDVPSVVSGQPIYYAIPHQYVETKEFAVAVHASEPPALQTFGIANSFDVEGRFARFEDYGRALYREEALPAVSPALQNAIYRWMGLFSATDDVLYRTPNVYWDPSRVLDHFEEEVFLEWNRTGGKFNYNVHEQQILSFLRFGLCGPLLAARSHVEYVRNSQFRHLWPEGCLWSAPPIGHGYRYVTSRGDSDVEHDWWRCARLWARLKGDDLLRSELLDHGRTLRGDNDRLVYYRAWVKGLEGLGLALSMARQAWPPLEPDPCTGRSPGDDLQKKLHDRLAEWFARTYDPRIPYDSEGWVSSWGSLLPQTLGNPWLSPLGWPQWGVTAHIERGVRHDHCYECVDPACGSMSSMPYGRRLFHEQLASSAFAIAQGALPASDSVQPELSLRICQLGFTLMSICHWNHQDPECPLPYPPPWAKEGDATHVWLPPPCDDPGYDHDGPLQSRDGDGQLGFAYAGQAARYVLLQYAALGNFEALRVTAVKFHEILAAQRFRDSYGWPCPGSPGWNNSYFDVNINDPGHWGLLWTLVQMAPNEVRASFPAYNPEASYYP
ncbi:MAG: hypothetical protein AB1486_15745 [Planctomycetota bacterium]